MKFEVRKVPVGVLEANCYLVWDAHSAADAAGARPCLVIDPGAEPEKIIAALREDSLRPEAIVATHCHFDHIGALDALLAEFPQATWAVGAPEAEWPARPAYNLSYGFGETMRLAPPRRLLADGDTIEITGLVDEANDPARHGAAFAGTATFDPRAAVPVLSFRVLAVPGHSPGSMCYYCEAGKSVFTGDALFAGDIGRADLPGGNPQQLVEAVRTKLLTLPDETVVWPGHANRSRIGNERRTNPYVGDNASGQ